MGPKINARFFSLLPHNFALCFEIQDTLTFSGLKTSSAYHQCTLLGALMISFAHTITTTSDKGPKGLVLNGDKPQKCWGFF